MPKRGERSARRGASEEFLRNDGLQREEQKTKEEVRIEFSVQTQEQTKYIWKDMINIGAAEDLLRSEIREHVIYMKEQGCSFTMSDLEYLLRIC